GTQGGIVDRATRKGDLCVHRTQLLQTAACRCTGCLPSLRKSVGIEAAECSLIPCVVRRTSCVVCARFSDARRTTHDARLGYRYSSFSSVALGITAPRWSSTVPTVEICSRYSRRASKLCIQTSTCAGS